MPIRFLSIVIYCTTTIHDTDIISKRSKVLAEQNINLDEMSLNELIKFIRENPSVLKRPIIVDDHRVQVGYNEEEIRTFIPRARRLAERYCSPEECENYASCKYCNPQIEGEGVQKP